MLPPSSSSDEGPAPRERDFDRRAEVNDTSYPPARFEGRGDVSGRGREDTNNRSHSDDEETEATTTADEERHAGGSGNDADGDNRGNASPPRALSHSELEELGFAAHLLLKISSSPIKRARVDLVSGCFFFWFGVFLLFRKKREEGAGAPPRLPFFFLPLTANEKPSRSAEFR